MEDRVRALERIVAQLEERDKTRKETLDGLSARLWAFVAVVLMFTLNNLLGLFQIGGAP